MANIIMVIALSFFALGIGLGIVLVLASIKLYRLGKARIIFWDADARSIYDTYLKPHDGVISTAGKTFLLEGKAKNGGKNSTWVIETRTGRNLICDVVSRSKTADKQLVEAILSVSNPESYHRALHRHRWTDILKAGDDDDKKLKLIYAIGLLALVGFVIIVGFMGYIVSKLPGGG